METAGNIAPLSISVPWDHTLSEREKSVVELYLDGWAPREIAEHLAISSVTVGTHMFHIRDKMRKLGVRFARRVTDQPRMEFGGVETCKP